MILNYAKKDRFSDNDSNADRIQAINDMHRLWGLDEKNVLRLFGTTAEEFDLICNNYVPGPDAAGPRFQAYINKNCRQACDEPWWTTDIDQDFQGPYRFRDF